MRLDSYSYRRAVWAECPQRKLSDLYSNDRDDPNKNVLNIQKFFMDGVAARYGLEKVDHVPMPVIGGA